MSNAPSPAPRARGPCCLQDVGAVTTDVSGAAEGGLVFRVCGAGKPGCRWEAVRNRLRLVVGDEARLWAKSELSWWSQPWFAHGAGPTLPAIAPPIRMTVVRSIH